LATGKFLEIWRFFKVSALNMDPISQSRPSLCQTVPVAHNSMVVSSSKRRKLDHGEEKLHKGRDSLEIDHLEDMEQSYTSKMASNVPTENNVQVASGRRSDLDVAVPYSGTTHKSSLFNLQVDEMLAEVRPNYSKLMGPIDDALCRLKTLIDSIDDRGPMTVGSRAVR
jgi:hypothetical protein